METGKFIGLLFQSRDMMHLQHLQTTSFAEHKALGHYYDGILELTDSFTEKYFGRNKRIPIVIPESKAMNAMDHLKSMQKLIEGEADLIVAKHRNGPTRTITVASLLHFAKFGDIAPKYSAPEKFVKDN